MQTVKIQISPADRARLEARAKQERRSMIQQASVYVTEGLDRADTRDREIAARTHA